LHYVWNSPSYNEIEDFFVGLGADVSILDADGKTARQLHQNRKIASREKPIEPIQVIDDVCVTELKASDPDDFSLEAFAKGHKKLSLDRRWMESPPMTTAADERNVESRLFSSALSDLSLSQTPAKTRQPAKTGASPQKTSKASVSSSS